MNNVDRETTLLIQKRRTEIKCFTLLYSPITRRRLDGIIKADDCGCHSLQNCANKTIFFCKMASICHPDLSNRDMLTHPRAKKPQPTNGPRNNELYSIEIHPYSFVSVPQHHEYVGRHITSFINQIAHTINIITK